MPLEHYKINHWSEGYFSIDNQGYVMVRPNPDNPEQHILLADIIEKLKTIGLSTPVLVRFSDILQNQVTRLNSAFLRAKGLLNYQGSYQTVYPIKVNQQRHVIEALVQHAQHAIGLEAGSKPELLAVLGLVKRPGSTIICNGYKDASFIRLALIGQKMGHKVIIVIEKLSELDLVLDMARELKVQPNLGVRVKLGTVGKGNWQNTGGEKSKFGLTTQEVLTLIETLNTHDQTQALSLLHFHLGSQISDVEDLTKGLRECAHIYSELLSMDVLVNTIDIGGGLGIDYDGTGSQGYFSRNYSLDEYAHRVVRIFRECCEQRGLPHPDIISESGRALTAHHAVLVTDILHSEAQHASCADIMNFTIDRSASPFLKNLYAQIDSLSFDAAPAEIENLFSQLGYYRSDALRRFSEGILSIKERAKNEQTVAHLTLLLYEKLKKGPQTASPIFQKIEESIADKLIANFSVFQSTPDVWGIDQIFPVVPLEQTPGSEYHPCLLQDITCDSDGRIDRYPTDQGVSRTLPLPSGYQGYLGIFLVGAYQEILGDMHNLFGDTHSVHVTLTPEGALVFEEPLKGDTLNELLAYVHIESQQLLAYYHTQLQNQGLSHEESQKLYQEISRYFESYSYLNESDKVTPR